MLTLILLFALAPVCATHAADAISTYSGSAVDLRSGRPLYSETHFLKTESNALVERVVLYACPDGTTFARKQVAYARARAARNPTPFAPEFEFTDVRTGFHEGLRRARDGVEVFFRRDRGAPEKTKSLVSSVETVADAGFDEFVRARWQTLMTGKKQPFAFVVPSRLETLKFQVAHVGSEVVAGVRSEIFKLRLSGILGWFLSSIDVYYRADNHTLIRYVGLSDLRDAKDDNYTVRIDFIGAARSTELAALEQAKGAKLVACSVL